MAHIFLTHPQECKVTNPDYTNMEKEDAVKDFLKRIEHYRLHYEPLDEEKESKYSFMKIFDAGKNCSLVWWLFLLVIFKPHWGSKMGESIFEEA